MDGILTLLCLFLLFMYGNGFLSQGFTDLHEIVHGGSATSQTGFLLFWRDSPRDGRVLGVNRGPYGGICFLLKHLCCYFLLSVPVQLIAWKDLSPN